MEEIFNINFEGYQTENDYISISKVRLWPAILASANWILKNRIPSHNLIQSGLGLTIINSLAVSIEGFIGDMIVQKLDNGEFIKVQEVQDLEKATWSDKLKLYNRVFEKKLNSYIEFESVEVLFILRNNFLHGLSHSEMIKRNILSGISSKVKSTNKKYQIAREYFTKNGFLKSTDVSSNVEILWRLQIVAFLFWEVQKFLNKIIADNKSQQFIGIADELKNAYLIR